MDLEAEQHVLESSVAPLHEEVGALTRHYEQQKRLLFAFGAALQRRQKYGNNRDLGLGHVPGMRADRNDQSSSDEIESTPTTPVHTRRKRPNSAGSSSSASRLHGRTDSLSRRPAPTNSSHAGVRRLIRELARRCGTPEVAFYQMDARGAGRLGAEDLEIGLLLGVCLDYWAITGLTAIELFTAMDRRGKNSITLGDLAACCPGVWRKHGAPQATPVERVRVLPWKALGGAKEAFEEMITVPAGPSADAGLYSGRSTGLSLAGFTNLVCQKMRGLTDDEASLSFTQLMSGRGGFMPQDVWAAATAEIKMDPLPLRWHEQS